MVTRTALSTMAVVNISVRSCQREASTVTVNGATNIRLHSLIKHVMVCIRFRYYTNKMLGRTLRFTNFILQASTAIVNRATNVLFHNLINRDGLYQS